MRPRRLMAYCAILLALVFVTFAVDGKPTQWLTGSIACMMTFGLCLFGATDVDE